MVNKLLATIILACSLVAVPLHGSAAEPHASSQAIDLSPDLLNLLGEEMREISVGMQAVALSLATGDWKSIQETSEQIQASYIMDKKLTAGQARELMHALPEDFKRIDAEFHRRAGRLGMAAAAHDPELVAFQYSRLIETCAHCHATYAKSRFPGFSSPDRQDHHH